MRSWKSGFVAVLMAAVSVAAFAEYDKATMQEVMQNNLANLPKLSAAADAARYMEAAGDLLSIATGMYSIKDYTPLKGDKAAWDQTITAFLATAFRGLAACADQNQAGLKAAVAELVRLRNLGHATFRP